MHSGGGCVRKKTYWDPVHVEFFNSGFLFNYNKDTENYTNYKHTAQKFSQNEHIK